MDGYSEIKNQKMAYDPEKDGVWLHDGEEPMAFIPRNIIIAMLGCLPSDPPRTGLKKRPLND